TTAAEIEAGITAMADKVWAWCEKAGAYGRTVTVKVKYADFHQVTRSHSFSSAIADRGLLLRTSVELVRRLLPLTRGIRLLGVTVSNFDRGRDDTRDLPLFGAGGGGLTSA